eukprot:CAMPEP_0113942520 /NCGR_PEP_ID=MMETSP1339-20121228/8226_1 /TAXON_ID=94617 /ORGANISM="Fibrocapsa japonica" /LENGTH=70 /DNA_ID=CAMNT_0000947033 /DNA_START=209 /DNA_END=421 /DNA_ORIENTATION=- /assembly_acc=CAM_ASM_000762
MGATPESESEGEAAAVLSPAPLPPPAGWDPGAGTTVCSPSMSTSIISGAGFAAVDDAAPAGDWEEDEPPS